MTLPVIYTPAPGPDDYKALRERGYHYVDKTVFIAEVLRNPGQVLLIPRPRRFGKSLNLIEKVIDEGETPEGALDAAHVQMVERGYAAELEAMGASVVHRLAVVFEGKQVWVS